MDYFLTDSVPSGRCTYFSAVQNISRVPLSQTKHVRFPYQLKKHTSVQVGTENIYEVLMFC